MYRQTPRNVALSASSSEFGYSNKLKTPSSLKKDARSNSWMSVDQNEAYVGNKNVLKSTDSKQRPALGLVSNKLGDRNNSSLAVLKKQTVSMPEVSKEKEYVFATPAPKKNAAGRRSNCSNLDYTPIPKYSEISLLSNTLEQCSIQIENSNRAGSVCSTEEEYEDVFSQDSPAPDSDYLSQPEVLRRIVSSHNFDIGDDFTQPFITETEIDDEGHTPEIMYHPASPDIFEPFYSDDEIFLMETMIRSDPEAPPPPPPEPMSFPARNWWDELELEPIPDFNETMEDPDSDLGTEFNCSGSDEECGDVNSEANQTSNSDPN